MVPPRTLQVAAWDCGLACACSAIRHYQVGDLKPTHAVIDFKSENKSDSVWSIDLVALLVRHGLDVTMYTSTLGVNDDFVEMPYYMKDLWRDIERVEKLFRDLNLRSVTKQAFLSCERVVEVLRSTLIIVLVDKNRLRCVNEPDEREENAFEGHYILVYAFHDGHFLYMDPDCSTCGACRVTVATFDEARTAHGTDDDLIVVGPPSGPAQNASTE